MKASNCRDYRIQYRTCKHSNFLVDGSRISLAEKDKFVDRLEQELEQNFLRYCDPLQPLHYLCMLAARSALTAMRLRSHHPRQYSDKGASLPQEEKDMLFRLALKIIQYDNLLHSSDMVQIFRWHIKVSDSNFSSPLIDVSSIQL